MSRAFGVTAVFGRGVTWSAFGVRRPELTTSSKWIRWRQRQARSMYNETSAMMCIKIGSENGSGLLPLSLSTCYSLYPLSTCTTLGPNPRSLRPRSWWMESSSSACGAVRSAAGTSR